jgi:exodeoxyribonuclease VII small subunit
MSSKKNAGFEAALQQLEQTVADLESGALGLDESLARFERGVGLLGRLRGLLDGAERRVALLTGVDASGHPVTSPFDGPAPTDRVLAPDPSPAVAEPPRDDEDDLPF